MTTFGDDAFCPRRPTTCERKLEVGAPPWLAAAAHGGASPCPAIPAPHLGPEVDRGLAVERVDVREDCERYQICRLHDNVGRSSGSSVFGPEDCMLQMTWPLVSRIRFRLRTLKSSLSAAGSGNMARDEEDMVGGRKRFWSAKLRAAARRRRPSGVPKK